MKNRPSLEQKILRRISKKKANILLREDFIDLGGYDQVGRALKNITSKGTIVRIGYGLYAKTKVSALTGETMPIASLPTLAKEALDRLGVKVVISQAESDYNEGRSTQIPTGRLIAVKNRIIRKISDKNVAIIYEYTH